MGPRPVNTVAVTEPLLSPHDVLTAEAESVTAIEDPTDALALAEQFPAPVTVTL